MHPREMRSLSLFVLLIACSVDSSDRSSAAASEAPRVSTTSAPAPSAPAADSKATAGAAATPTRRAPSTRADTAIIRGIYVNRWAAQSPRKMRNLIALADSTEINAFVIDIKDE